MTRPAAPPPEDQAHFRKVMSHYPTGVCAVTSLSAEGAPLAMVVGSFCSVSLNPPLVGFLPAKSSDTWPLLEAAGRFCVNVLAADQRDLCLSMAAKTGDRFAGLDWTPSAAGLPMIAGAIAWIDCDLEGTSPAGDHHFVLGRVRELRLGEDRPALLFHRGGFGEIG